MMSDKDARNWAMLCHLTSLLGLWGPWLNTLGPLCLWLLRRNDSRFVNEHGKEAVNFNISLAIYLTVAAALMFVVIGFFIYPVIFVLGLIFAVQGAVNASKGKAYTYPFTIRFIQ